MNQPLTPGFMLLQGNRLEDLRDVMLQWISDHPLNPLEQECMLVQSNGIAQWLNMALAQQTGIAAAVQVDLPGRFVWQAYRSLFSDLPDQSPFDKAALGWRLYRLLADLPALAARLSEPDCLNPLRLFLQQDEDPRRLYQLSMNLADLYDQYQVYRADWLRHWETGRDELPAASGVNQPLPTEQHWQPAIWRLLVADIAAGHASGQHSRAHIHQQFIRACSQLQQRPPRLPRRVILFGLSALPRQTLEVLQAISPFVQLLVFVTNPSQHYWGDLIEGRALLRQTYRRQPNPRHNQSLSLAELHLHGHPLLAAWGKQGRDYLHLLDELDQPDTYRSHFQQIDLFQEPGQDCLLHQLQSDILNLVPLHERQQQHTCIDPTDQSLQFLVAHSPQREVEILHDQLLEAFNQAQQQGNPLQPRDVLVMVPDINVYAPHIQAVFGRHLTQPDKPQDGRYLPFHLADQSQRHRHTLLIALEKILHLPTSRCTLTELLDLLDTPALRLRFALDETDLPRLRQWVEGANIRWGLDAEQRTSLGLPDGLEQNTWLFGLRRMLLGFASGQAPAWQGIEPYAEVGGLDAALVGPLQLLLDRLQHTRQQLAQAHTASHWLAVLQQLLQDYFHPADDSDSHALAQIQQQLNQLHKLWHSAGIQQQTLSLEAVRSALLDGLDQPHLAQKFLGGAINFATLMPMRAIPFRQIWLLGMNDGDYPRSVRPADFDLMAQDYRPGDRSRREDDRYLFLEALLSARERLVISWVGRSIRDNSECPPSVLVSQLRDHLAAGWLLADEPPGNSEIQRRQQLLQALTCVHPLQPFSPDYCAPQRNPRLLTYAREWFATGSPATTENDPPLPPWKPDAPLSLRQLKDLLQSPLDALYRERLQLGRPEEAKSPSEVENFSLDGLQRWQLLDQLLQDCLTSEPPETFHQRLEQARIRLQGKGWLPDGALGQITFQQITAALPVLHHHWHQLRSKLQPLPPLMSQLLSLPQMPELQLELQPGPYFHAADQGYCQLLLQTSSLATERRVYRWKHLLLPWLQHLAAQLLLPQPVTTHLLTPGGRLLLAPVTRAEATGQLQQLMQLWLTAMHQPLPCDLNTGMAWLMQREQTPDQADRATQAAATAFRNAQASGYDNPYLYTRYTDFDHFWHEPESARLAEKLYLPLYQTLQQARLTMGDET